MQQEQNTLAQNVSAKFLLVLSGSKVRDYRQTTSKIAVIVLGDLQRASQGSAPLRSYLYVNVEVPYFVFYISEYD